MTLRRIYVEIKSVEYDECINEKINLFLFSKEKIQVDRDFLPYTDSQDKIIRTFFTAGNKEKGLTVKFLVKISRKVEEGWFL
jgi:hypothetical protein